MEFLQKYSELLACISFLMPLIPGWMFFRKLHGELKLFIFILSITFILEYTGYYTSAHDIHNLVVYNLSYIFQFYFYSVLFRKLLPSNFSKWFIRIITALFTIYIGFRMKSVVFPNNMYNSYIPAFLSLSIILYCILYFNHQLGDMHTTFIYKTPWFWIMTGLLLYFSGSFLILLVTSYFMFRANDYINYLWTLLFLFDIIKNILIGIGFLFLKIKGWSRSF